MQVEHARERAHGRAPARGVERMGEQRPAATRLAQEDRPDRQPREQLGILAERRILLGERDRRVDAPRAGRRVAAQHLRHAERRAGEEPGARTRRRSRRAPRRAPRWRASPRPRRRTGTRSPPRPASPPRASGSASAAVATSIACPRITGPRRTAISPASRSMRTRSAASAVAARASVEQCDGALREARQPCGLGRVAEQPRAVLAVRGEARAALERRGGVAVRAAPAGALARVLERGRRRLVGAGRRRREMPRAPVVVAVGQRAGQRAVGGAPLLGRRGRVDGRAGQRVAEGDRAVAERDEPAPLRRRERRQVDAERRRRALEQRRVAAVAGGGERRAARARRVAEPLHPRREGLGDPGGDEHRRARRRRLVRPVAQLEQRERIAAGRPVQPRRRRRGHAVQQLRRRRGREPARPGAPGGRRRRAATARPRARRAPPRSGRRPAAGRRTAAPGRSSGRATARRRRAPRPGCSSASAASRPERRGADGEALLRGAGAQRERRTPAPRPAAAAAARASASAGRSSSSSDGERDLAPRTRSRARAARACRTAASAAWSSSAVFPIPGSPTSASDGALARPRRRQRAADRLALAVTAHAAWARRYHLGARPRRPGGRLKRAPAGRTYGRAMTTTRHTPSRSTATSSMQFVFRAVDEVGATLNAALVVMGDKLGLYRALAGRGPLTPAELAAADRHRRALRARVAATPRRRAATSTTTPTPAATRSPPEQAVALHRPGEPRVPAGLLPARARRGDRLAADHRGRAHAATGSAGTSTSHDVHDGCERFFRPGYNANLVAAWLPALDGVVEKLERGARVADVGCGHGSSTILMAEAFPRSTLRRLRLPRGLDRDRADPSGRGGRRRTACASTAEPAAAYSGDGYDLVTMFDCLHDMGDPVGAARHVRSTLAPDGTWMIVEPYAGDRIEDNLNPVGRAYYAFSHAALHAGLALAGGRARARRAGRRGADPRRRRGGRVHALPPRGRDAVQPRLRGAAVTLAGRPRSAPAAGAPREQSRARYPDAHGHVERDGVRIAYEVYGSDGPAVLLLPDVVDRALADVEGADPLSRPPLPRRDLRRPRQRPLGPAGRRSGVCRRRVHRGRARRDGRDGPRAGDARRPLRRREVGLPARRRSSRARRRPRRHRPASPRARSAASELERG